MGETAIPPVENTSGGWQCPYCLAWVPFSETHQCPGLKYTRYEPEGADFTLTVNPACSQCLTELQAMNRKLASILQELTTIRLRR